MSELDPELRSRAAAAPVARLATVRRSGRPHLVPITFALDGDVIVTAIDHKPKSTSRLQRLKNIEANPFASVLIDEYGDDWTRIWWVRADGRAGIVGDGPEHRKAVDLLVAKYPQYRQQRPAGPVIAVRVDRWAGWPA